MIILKSLHYYLLSYSLKRAELGKPGIRIIFPKIGIKNLAPAAISISLTVILNPSGRPINFSLSEK